MRNFALGFCVAALLTATSTPGYALDVCGNGAGGQVFGVIGGVQEDGDARIVTAKLVTESTCSAFLGSIRYTGSHFLFSDCTVGKTFTAVGSLKADGEKYSLEADVMRCE